MPDPTKILTTIRRATELMRATPGRSGGIITLERAAEVMVVGDLHGNLPAFKKVLALAALDRHPGRHLVLQELIHGPLMYPDDKGDRSHQLLDVFAALKCQYPERVHLILGNHELSELTGRSIGKDGEGLNAKFRAGHRHGLRRIGRRDLRVLQGPVRRPAPGGPDRRIASTSATRIPDATDLDTLDLDLLKADVWPEEAMKRRGTIYALTWGRDTTPETADRFAAMVDADFFITGHQPCDEGFRQANHRQIIIDGTNPYPVLLSLPR